MSRLNSARGRQIRLASALIALSVTAACGEDGAVDSQQAAYRNSIAQETVRKQADKIQADLLRLVTELKLNGLENGNLPLLSQASKNLSGLSTEQMQKVINALQSATIATDDGTRRQSLVTAFQGQQELVLKLKQLATELARQNTDRLVNQLESLMARQAAAARETAALKASGHTPDQMDAKEKAQLAAASAKQAAISGEIDLLAKNLASQPAPTDLQNPDDSNQAAKAVLEAINKTGVKEASQQAAQSTTSGALADATDKQAKVQTALAEMLHAAVSEADALERLNQAKTQLSQVKSDQDALNDVTKQAKLDSATLADRQAEINDRAEVAKALLKPLNPDATKQVDAAQQDMKQAAEALATDKKTDAATKQTDAAKALDDADKLLDQQIAVAEKQQDQSPVDQMAQLQKAQDEIKTAQQQEQTSMTDAEKTLQQAQQDALMQSPDAAALVADAASDLQSNTDAANQKLTQANDELEKQKQALAQAAQDYQALAQASQQLDQARQLAVDADQKIQDTSTTNFTEPARKLTDAQGQVSQVQQNIPKSLPGEAGQALQQAQDALKNATNQAVQANRSGADAQAKQGIAALDQARGAMKQAMSQMLAHAGQKNGKGHGQHALAAAGQMPAGAAGAPGQLIQSGNGPDAARGSALVVGGLAKKDRDAITQFQAEKSPPEYAPLVQQYLKNLSDTSTSP